MSLTPAIVKKNAGYVAVAPVVACATCRHRVETVTMPVWMIGNPVWEAEFKAGGVAGNVKQKCGTLGFAVQMRAVCNHWERAVAPASDA